jgi:4-amino-4-deoxy-L-arabinose transferase-like glycosyltransferase
MNIRRATPAALFGILSQLERQSSTFWVPFTVGLGLLIGLYKLHLYPGNINPDAADTLQTYLIASIRGEPSFFSYNWNGAPAVNMYLIGWTWELFGESIFGLRLLSALFGAITLGIFFLVVDRFTHQKLLAFATALLLFTNPWYLNFSRDAWENVWNAVPVLLIVWGLYELFEGPRRRLAFGLLASGSVLGFYFYHPGKLFAPAVMLILLGHWLWKRWPSYRFLGLFLGLVLLFTVPQLYSSLDPNRHPSRYNPWHRIRAVSVSNQPDGSTPLLNSTLVNLRSFLLFDPVDFDRSTINDRYLPLHVRPILAPLLSLYWIGLVIGMLRYKYLVVFYLLILLPVQILSIATPNAARAVHAVPMIFLFIALGLHQILWLVALAWAEKAKLLYGLAVCLFLGMAIFQLQVYFRWIQAPETVKARQPAVDRAEYGPWLQAVKQNVEQGNGRLSVKKWRSLTQQ